MKRIDCIKGESEVTTVSRFFHACDDDSLMYFRKAGI